MISSSFFLLLFFERLLCLLFLLLYLPFLIQLTEIYLCEPKSASVSTVEARAEKTMLIQAPKKIIRPWARIIDVVRVAGEKAKAMLIWRQIELIGNVAW